MTYEEARAFIRNVKWQNSKPGLSRTRELLEKLGNPEKKLKFIHVAGTNGKGSTCAMLASMLEAAGYRTGLYTSPFIYDFTERFQVNRENISHEDLAALTERIRPFAEAMEDAPTEFEIITAIAMLYFLEQKCDIVVLEVGMGGELDSTNVIPVPEAAVITAIGLDHTEWLGKTIEEIAAAKAGIIKEGGDVVFYGQNPEAEGVIRRICEERHARLHLPSYDRLNLVMTDIHGQVFDYLNLCNLKLSLPGTYQMYNAAVALTTIRMLNRKEGTSWFIGDEAVVQGLEDTRWRGRLELVSEHPLILLDGSHNPQGIRATAESLQDVLPDQKFVFVVSSSSDKDVQNGLAHLAPLAQEFITVTHGFTARAMKAEKLAELLREYTDVPVTAASGMAEGCDLALQKTGRRGAICVTGSLYGIREAAEALKTRLPEKR